MKAFFKRNLHWIFFAGWGLLSFIWLAIPYINAVVDYGDWGGFAPGGKNVYKTGISGYKVMSLWELGFGGVMSSLFQIFILLAGIALLALGVVGFLKEYNIVPKIPDKLGKFELKKIGVFLLLAYAAMNILLLIFLIITCASNSEEAYGTYAGYKLNAGIFLTLIFSIGAFVGLLILDKKFIKPADVVNTETVDEAINMETDNSVIPDQQ